MKAWTVTAVVAGILLLPWIYRKNVEKLALLQSDENRPDAPDDYAIDFDL